MLRDYLFRILRPAYWIQTRPTDDVYSAALEREIDAGAAVTNRKTYTVDLGGVTLWIDNYPSAYGYHYSGSQRLPTARVRRKLRDYLSVQGISDPWADKDGDK